MDFIREYQLLKLNMIFTQALGQVHGLSEWNVSIIVAMDQQYGRFPG